MAQLHMMETGPADNQTPVTLPDGLRRQFAALEKRLWTLETVMAVCCVMGGLALSYLVLFVSDRIWDTPVGLRVVITLAGIGVSVWAVWRWVSLWIINRRNQEALSVLVQKKFRRLGDRLLGIVELAHERRHAANFSPALYRAAIQQVAAEALKFDFKEAVNLRPAKFHAAVLVGLLGLVSLPVALVPAAGWNVLVRWATPTAAIARYTLVELEALPIEKVVPHGEDFEVGGAVRYRSFWKPGRAVARYDRQPKLETAVTASQVRFRVPGQIQRGILKVKVGDAQREVAVVPSHRPSLKQLTANVELPAYLQYPPVKENVQHGALTILEGSRVSFAGKTSRALATAQMQMHGKIFEPLKVEGESFSSDPAGLDGISQAAFTWRDNLGLEVSAPWRLAIQTQKDSPPMPEISDLQRDTAILESEILELKTAARDDFGVRDLGLNWELASDWMQTNSLPARQLKTQSSSPQEKKLEQTFNFSPAMLQIPAGATLEFRAYATDYFPDRLPAESPVYRVHILGNEDHAEMVRQKLESLLVQLEEVTRLEEKIATGTREAKDLPKEKLEADETTRKLNELANDQMQNANNLEQIAREGMKALREAVRNPVFNEQTLQEWAKNLQQMQQLSQQQMKQAAGSLKSAQQSKESRPQDLADAQQKEEEALQALEKMQQKVNQGLDDLQALTLAQRLRKLGGNEEAIEGQIQKCVPETIGLTPQELPEKFKKLNASLATEQDNTQKESQTLQGEISRFFERTQKENYGAVNKEMTEAKTSEELDKVRGLIQENIAMEAAKNLATWAERFNKWADKLEPKEASGSGGGEGGEGEEQNLTKQLIALLRMKEGEMNLREQTRFLEQQKPEPAVYAGRAGLLASNQRKLGESLARVQQETPIPPLIKPLQDTAEAMQEVVLVLNKPRTDQVADKAETKTIELLSDVINLINEQAKKGGGGQSNSSSAEDMAFLMEMMSPENQPNMGMSMSSKGGGSMAGGTTDRAGNQLGGDAAGKGAGARNVSRASGVTANMPAEFREALENYFKAVEQEAK